MCLIDIVVAVAVIDIVVAAVIFLFFFFTNGNTEQARCAFSRVCIPQEKEKVGNDNEINCCY